MKAWLPGSKKMLHIALELRYSVKLMRVFFFFFLWTSHSAFEMTIPEIIWRVQKTILEMLKLIT